MKCLLLTAALLLLLTGCKLSEITPDQVGMISRSLENIGSAARPMSDQEEYYVGRAVSARLLSSYRQLKDPALTSYINLVGQSVALQSERPVTFGGYHFAILDSPELNAFAAPGGMIFVTRGMLATIKSEDELAAVLAHEVGHVVKRHGIAAIQSSRWSEALTVIGSDAAKTFGGSDVAKLAKLFDGSIDDVFKTLVVNGYGRSQEEEADGAALGLLVRAGYDPAALEGYLQRLAAAGKSSSGGMLSTHPGTDERIQHVREKMPTASVNKSFQQARTSRFLSAMR